jgi:beta-glucosidase
MIFCCSQNLFIFAREDPMKLTFPDSFHFGTSTSAYQIETAVGHDWSGIKARDGHIFQRTTDHEKRFSEDIRIISSLAPHYRMGLMWSKLQREPLAGFDPAAKAYYHQLLSGLKEQNVSIMMVLHHFGNPLWFAKAGGWSVQKNVPLWCDYARRVIDEFGKYVSCWNTFNEPNLYATLAYLLGEFPPYKKSMYASRKVIGNMGKAHDIIYDYLKSQDAGKPVGISHNCAVFVPQNVLGQMTSSFADLWYMDFMPKHFMRSDFFGISYYARVAFDPFPVTQLYTPQKMIRFRKEHDDIWEYYPQGLYECIERYWTRFGKPIIVAENGICTNDDTKRVTALKDYMKELHRALTKKMDVRGYYHWSTWDNFEWTLGPSYRFGLYECDPESMERKKKPSADVYSKLAYEKEIDV